MRATRHGPCRHPRRTTRFNIQGCLRLTHRLASPIVRDSQRAWCQIMVENNHHRVHVIPARAVRKTCGRVAHGAYIKHARPLARYWLRTRRPAAAAIARLSAAAPRLASYAQIYVGRGAEGGGGGGSPHFITRVSDLKCGEIISHQEWRCARICRISTCQLAAKKAVAAMMVAAMAICTGLASFTTLHDSCIGRGR